MKLLVTGGAGFIGSAVVRTIVEATSGANAHSSHPSPGGITVEFNSGQTRPWPRSVVNVDCLTMIPEDLVNSVLPPQSDKHVFIRADIRDSSTLSSIFAAHQPDAVLHLAAETHVDNSIKRPCDFIETNIVGTYNLLEAALEYWRDIGRPEGFCFHHVSTDEVFGRLGTAGRFSEDSRYDPRNPYSATKAASDHLVRAWHETYGLPVLISNCSNNFGPFQLPDKFIPRVITRALAGHGIPIYGTGDQRRDWIFVNDHVAALIEVLTRGQIGHSYNIGAENELRNFDLASKVCDILDRLCPSVEPHANLIRMVTDRPGHDYRYAINPERIRKELNWKPQFTMEEGLETTVRWYLDNPNWWKTLVRAAEDRMHSPE